MSFIRPLICSALLFTLLLAGCDPKHLNLGNHNNSTDLAKLQQALKDYNASEVDSICQKNPSLGLELNYDSRDLDLLVQNSPTAEALFKKCSLEDSLGKWLLSRAIFKKKKELVKFIIKHQPILEHSLIPDPDAPTRFVRAIHLARNFGIYLDEKLELQLAIQYNEAAKVQSLCEDNPSLGLENNDMGAPFLSSVFNTSDAVLALLEHCHIPLSFRDNQQNSLLITITKRLQTVPELEEVILKFIDKAPAEYLEIKNNNHESVFSWAIYSDNQNIIDALLANNADLEVQLIAMPHSGTGVLDTPERHSFKRALKINDAAKVQSLCQRNPDLGLGNSDNGLPFLSSVFNTSDAVLALLEHCHIPLSFRDDDQNSLLITMTKYLETVPALEEVVLKFIDKASSDYLAVTNNRGESAFSWASYLGKDNISTALLNKDPEIKNKRIKMPYTSAGPYTPKVHLFKDFIRANDADGVRTMCDDDKNLGLELNSRNKPFLLDASNKKEAALALVSHCDIALSFRDENQNSLLSLAIIDFAKEDLEEVILKLIDKAPVDYLEIKNGRNESALSWAIYLESYDIAKALLKKAPQLKAQQIKLPLHSLVPATTPIDLAQSQGMDLSDLKAFENEFALAKEQDGNEVFHIKQPALKPVFIRKDGTFFDDKDVDDISFDEFAEVDYVLLPQSHWFAKLFIDNPFKEAPASISLTRPSIWGLALDVKKEDQQSVLFSKKNGKLVAPKFALMDQSDLYTIFGDFNNHSLGKGAYGEVFAFSYNGQEYALKKYAPEYAELEKLQFSNAVIEVYGSFTWDGKKFMIMKKGIKSLDKMIKDNEILSDDEILRATKRFSLLGSAQKKLGIKNNDIKPHNMLMTDDGLKVIDISQEMTLAYVGSMGELLARALIESRFGYEFLGYMSVSLEQYYDFHSSYRKLKIASDEYITHWFQLLCTEYNLSHDCSTVTSYDVAFPLFKPEQLMDLSQKGSNYFINIGYEGYFNIHDDLRYGNYRTGLALPQLSSSNDDEKWQEFFDEKSKIAEVFCLYIKEPIQENYFYGEIRKKYEDVCSKPENEVLDYFNGHFGSHQDPEFRQWILDAFYPIVKMNTFKALAILKHDKAKVLESLLKDKLPINVVDELMRLYRQ